MDHRPVYHLTAPTNWMNDPNGLIQAGGQYHAFYQHNPHGAGIRNIRWGHAVSGDMLRWDHLPVALSPGEDYDRAGCWSGNIVAWKDRYYAFYTGVAHPPFFGQSQCLAVSKDLLHWEKHSANPVIPHPPKGVSALNFRDPYVWRSGENWWMAVGANLWGAPAVLRYESSDLLHWRYQGPLHTGHLLRHGWMWECPSVFRLGQTWVLLVSSVGKGVYWFTGDWAGGRLKVRREGVLENGGCFFAPQVFVDEQGRAIMMGWLKETRTDLENLPRQGALSLPRELYLSPGGDLSQRPVSQAADLLKNPPGPAAQGRGSAVIQARINMAGARAAGLSLCSSQSRAEETVVAFSRPTKRLLVRQSQSGGLPGVHRASHGIPLALAAGEPLELLIFVDQSVLEVFAHGVCRTSRVYPSQPGTVDARLYSQGGQARLEELVIQHV